MTDEQAWRTIAAAYETLAETGRATNATRWGLCNALDVVRVQASGYDSRAHRTLQALMTPEDCITLASFWRDERNPDTARLRATVALLMAELAADDGGNHKEA